MRRTRRALSIVIAVIMVMAMSVSAFAAGTSSNGARNIALKNAKLTKSQVKNLKVKYDRKDADYDVKFIRKSNGAKYDYEIRKSNGKITEKSIEYKVKKNKSKKKIGKTAAFKKASKMSGVRLAAVKKGRCKYDYDDGQGVYEVKFRNGKYVYEIEIQAATGTALEYSWEYKAR